MRDSFILYTEYAEHFELLTMEQRGILFTAIMAYQREEELPDMDGCVRMAFSFIRKNLDREAQKYEETKAKRSAAGIASAEAKRNKGQHKATNSTGVESVEHKETNSTVNVNVNDNVNVLKKKSKKEKAVISTKDIDEFKISDPVIAGVESFIEHRKGMKKPMSDNAVHLLIKKLYEMGQTDKERIELLDEAVLHGWMSIYPFKESPPKLKPPKKNRFTNFDQREYDEDDLELSLLEGVRG